MDQIWKSASKNKKNHKHLSVTKIQILLWKQCQRHKLQLCQMQHATVKEFRASPKIGRDVINDTKLQVVDYEKK